MGLISNFKKLFNKTINILPHQRNDVVSFVKLRNGMVKIGSEAIVDENYNLVFVYYNKVCDILRPGEHKINDDTVPRLFKYSKANLTKRGLFTANSIKSDAYYICLKEFEHNMFKTQEKVICYNEDEKVKIRLDGTFTFKVADTERFMVALCNDYAIIRNKKIIKELCSTVGFEVSKALNSKKFLLDDYIFNKDKIVEAIQEGVNKHTMSFGVEVSKFFVTNVIAPRKYLSDVQIKNLEKTVETGDTENVDVVKLVEDRLNNLQKDLGVVYVDEKGGNSFEHNNTAKEQPTYTSAYSEDDIFVKTQTSNMGSNVEPSTNSYNYNNIDNSGYTIEKVETFNQPEPSILSPEPNILSAEPELFSEPKPATRQKRTPAKKEEYVEINDELVDTIIDKIDKRKKQKKNNRIVEILTKAGVDTTAEANSVKTSSNKCSQCGESLAEGAKFCFKCGSSTETLKICACCGAKNFSNATTCCVCKSSLD